jgi:hypothetical protein
VRIFDAVAASLTRAAFRWAIVVALYRAAVCRAAVAAGCVGVIARLTGLANAVAAALARVTIDSTVPAGLERTDGAAAIIVKNIAIVALLETFADAVSTDLALRTCRGTLRMCFELARVAATIAGFGVSVVTFLARILNGVSTTCSCGSRVGSGVGRSTRTEDDAATEGTRRCVCAGIATAAAANAGPAFE